MIERVIKFFVREPVITVALILALIGTGTWAYRQIPIDAIPNISDQQVIVLTKWMGRSPKDVEDQITYPLSVAMLSVPGAESVRGKSLFGFSFVQITFKDDVDFYWARSRVSEQLSVAASKLPEGVNPVLGPDATALGQIYYYVLQGPPEKDLAELRSLQDYVIRYALQAVEGVSEVASIGGYVREYQIDVDPDKLTFHSLNLNALMDAVRGSNLDVGAKTIEENGMEFVIRGRGYVGTQPGKQIEDLENTVILSRDSIPVRVQDVSSVHLGPAFRRGALDFNGAESVGGVVVMRYGENPKTVINRIKEKIAQLEPSLDGVKVVGIYDRTHLIDETIATLTGALTSEILITMAIIFLFLLNWKSSLIVASTLPLTVLFTFIGMALFRVDANIMSLAGIAIAIGTIVDVGIVVVENIVRRLNASDQTSGVQTIVAAVQEVAPAIMTAMTTTIISFLPVFFLTGRDYKLFAPLAATKTIALVGALIIGVIVPAVFCRVAFTGKATRLPDASSHFMSRGLYAVYEVVLNWCLSHRKVFVLTPTLLVLVGSFFWPGYSRLTSAVEKVAPTWTASTPWQALRKATNGIKSDDWIALDEGAWFYMPTLLPAASFSEAMRVLQSQDVAIKSIPEVENVLGKIGRIDSALDPAPAAMIETYVTLKPKPLWRAGVTEKSIWNEISQKATFPGVTPAAPLQPIEGRVVMLQSGIKAAMAIRIYGDDLEQLAKVADATGELLQNHPYVDSRTINPDIVLGKPYAEFTVDRLAAGRYGMTVSEVNRLIEAALGGTPVTTTVEGRERYDVIVRYLRQQRENLKDLDRLLVITNTGDKVPLSRLASLSTTWGPGAITSENARLVAHVAFAPNNEAGAIETVDGVMASLRQAQAQGDLSIPPGYEIEPVGSFQNQVEANRRMAWIIPLVILINLFVIYLQFRKWALSLIIFAAVPVAFSGGMIFVGLWGGELNTAVWVGFIALFGIAVDDGVLMMTYLEQTFRGAGKLTRPQIREKILAAGLKRIRPAMMTTATTLIALVPILMASGRGADVARAMALPVFGGMMVAILTVLVVPILYSALKESELT